MVHITRFFSSQLPRDNLWVLNDFIASEQVSDYMTKVLGDEDVAVRVETVDTMLQQSIDRVFIFSMGLQWTNANFKRWVDWPCDIVSPSEKYEKIAIETMIKNIKKSKKATLRAFYKSCFTNLDDWTLWNQVHGPEHEQYTDETRLVGWLDALGNKCVMIPDKANLTLWMDPNDPIGSKPNLNHASNITCHIIQNGGHFLRPLDPEYSVFL